MTTLIRKIVVANRGEIACRIIRTAHEQGFFTVALYSDADANALHVKQADEAVRIGAADAASSYLNIDSIIRAAKLTNADAVHPGYGFLSENADFANACEAANLIFIGPSANAIELMGSKRLSKLAMIKAGVPCVPGYQGAEQSNATLLQKANEIGFPIMVKASAGGGGKGMRLVHDATDLASQITMARSEALNAFGSDELILERALISPRHIEIQVFADNKGNTIYLGERDCSIQRRHQKVIEEAPSPFIDAELRKRMGDAAVNAAKACGYRGAGTVEFLVDEDRQFYFLEMNTRLQVEHPVTEMVTGIDLVAWQLSVACGEPLPLSQNDITITGHAIEARLYAEDPRQDFMPQTGNVYCWREADNTRTDHGIHTDQKVSTHYDPMLAKVIVWAENRNTAARKLSRALYQTQLLGVNTNKHFLQNILTSTAFLSSEVTTDFISKYADTDEMRGASSPSFALLAIATVLFSTQHEIRAEKWENTTPLDYPIKLLCDGETTLLTVTHQSGQFVVRCKQTKQQATIYLVSQTPNTAVIEFDNRRHLISYAIKQNSLFIDDGSGHFHIEQVTHQPTQPLLGDDPQQCTDICAVMDGVIVALMLENGADVKAGDTVAIMEAMKMEHPLKAKTSGLVSLSTLRAGDQVKSKQVIATILPNKEPSDA